jgi:NAD(P)-dependent dehydrogenase (short-subunit alcohol dehydrogenase family)
MMLRDKIILVTGGSGLLGRSFIKDIYQKGGLPINGDISLTTDLDKGQLKLDITDNDSIKEGIDLIISKYGRIDGLVNNAYPRTKDWGTPFSELNPDSWRRNLDMQLNSYVFCCQKSINQMKEQFHGSIVNIASIYGVVANDPTLYFEANLTPPAEYTAIKGALINFTKYLSSMYGEYNIRANCVSPGGIFDNQPESFVANYEQRVPLKRMGNPDDIAPAVSFLLSDEAKYITGHNLMVDGGWTAI